MMGVEFSILNRICRYLASLILIFFSLLISFQSYAQEDISRETVLKLTELTGDLTDEEILTYAQYFYQRGLDFREENTVYPESFHEHFKNGTNSEMRYLLAILVDTGHSHAEIQKHVSYYNKYSEPDKYTEAFDKLLKRSKHLSLTSLENFGHFAFDTDDQFTAFVIKFLALGYDSTTYSPYWSPELFLNNVQFNQFDDHAWAVNALYNRSLSYYYLVTGQTRNAIKALIEEYDQIPVSFRDHAFDHHAVIGNIAMIAERKEFHETAKIIVSMEEDLLPSHPFNSYALQLRKASIEAALGNYHQALSMNLDIISRVKQEHDTLKNYNSYQADTLLATALAYASFFAAIVGDDKTYNELLNEYYDNFSELDLRMKRAALAVFVKSSNIEKYEDRRILAQSLLEAYYDGLLPFIVQNIDSKAHNLTLPTTNIGRKLSSAEIRIYFDQTRSKAPYLETSLESAKQHVRDLNVSGSKHLGSDYTTIMNWSHRGVSIDQIQNNVIEKGDINLVSELEGLSAEAFPLKTLAENKPTQELTRKAIFDASAALNDKFYEGAAERIVWLDAQSDKNPELAVNSLILSMRFSFAQGDLIGAVDHFNEIYEQHAQTMSPAEHFLLIELLADGLRQHRLFSEALDIIQSMPLSQAETPPVSFNKIKAQLLADNGDFAGSRELVNDSIGLSGKLSDIMDFKSIELLNAAFDEDFETFRSKYNNLRPYNIEAFIESKFVIENKNTADHIWQIRTREGPVEIIDAGSQERKSHELSIIEANSAANAMIRAQQQMIDNRNLALENDIGAFQRGNARRAASYTALFTFLLALIYLAHSFFRREKRSKDQNSALIAEIDELSTGLKIVGSIGHFQQGKIMRRIDRLELAEDTDVRELKNDMEELNIVLFDLTKLIRPQNKEDFSRQSIQSSHVSKYFRREFQKIQKSSQTDLAINLCDNHLTFTCDRLLLNSIIEKAIKFCCAETAVGTIEIRISINDQDPSFLQIQIDDEGMGQSLIDTGLQLEDYWSSRQNSSALRLSVVATMLTSAGGYFFHEGVIGVGNHMKISVPIKITGKAKNSDVGNDNIVPLRPVKKQ